MGRRSFISMTAIKRMVSASNRLKRERYNNNLIQAQGGNEKEKAPTYTLNKVEFNINTRITRIEILQTQEYRTIQKYVTQNYQKYPIYSEWKIKEKIIKKSIKLTNSELELLNTNEDELIAIFAEDIIIELGNEELFPSWFIKLYLKRELDSDLKNMKNKLNEYRVEQNDTITNKAEEIKNINIENEKFHKKLLKFEKIKSKKQKLLERLSLAKKNVFKGLFTFGIYLYLISNRRKIKIESKLLITNSKILDINENINRNTKIIDNCNKTIEKCKVNINNYEKDYTSKKDSRVEEFNHKISEVKPLANVVNQDDSFMMLKLFGGLEYERIIGVYVIHNKEKDKYYVGQSKDVMKRIKQHFNGTVPKNQIFAEDYYTSQIEDKNNLFEIKIIKCETKDELDSLEKQLIYEYDSWNRGYNGTSGNI